MRLMEAIIEANHRAVAGDTSAGLRPSEFENELPLVALTCIDARLNPVFPEVLGVPEDKFVWLRNAGNIVTGPLSSTTRSLSLACAIKGGKEIAIIGHTDCLVGKTSTMQLIEALQAQGVERRLLPDNINEYFGVFASERQNVLRGVEIVRRSPLVGPAIPVHGLIVDTATGRLEWLVNGYQTLATKQTLPERWHEVVESAEQTVHAFKSLTDFKIGGIKFPETKIGEIVSTAQNWASEKLQQIDVKPPEPGQSAPPPLPHKIPLPPPLRPRITGRRGPK